MRLFKRDYLFSYEFTYENGKYGTGRMMIETRSPICRYTILSFEEFLKKKMDLRHAQL